MDDEVRGELAFPIGPPPQPPSLPMHRETIPMTAPLIASIQAGMDTGGSGAAGVSIASARRPSFQFELREGSDKSVDARNHGL